MTDHEALLSRRALLAAGLGGIAFVAGCTTHPRRPVADPDAAAIEAARAGERLLLASYPEGSDGQLAHLAHLRALGGSAPTSRPTSAPPASPGQPSAGAAASETASVAPLLAAARAARRGSTAALLASIGASHAVLGGVPSR